MTESMPNSSMLDAPEEGFDPFHPVWPAQLIVALASEQAGDLNGQGFIVWGGNVALVRGWHIVGSIAEDDPFSAVDFLERKDELFGDNPREPAFMQTRCRPLHPAR